MRHTSRPRCSSFRAWLRLGHLSPAAAPAECGLPRHPCSGGSWAVTVTALWSQKAGLPCCPTPRPLLRGGHWLQLLHLPNRAARPLEASAAAAMSQLWLLQGRRRERPFLPKWATLAAEQPLCAGEKAVVLTEASSRLGLVTQATLDYILLAFICCALLKLQSESRILYVLVGFSMALSIVVFDCSSRRKSKWGYAGSTRDSISELCVLDFITLLLWQRRGFFSLLCA